MSQIFEVQNPYRFALVKSYKYIFKDKLLTYLFEVMEIFNRSKVFETFGNPIIF